MINTLQARNGVKVSEVTPSRWQVSLDAAIPAQLASLSSALAALTNRIASLEARVLALETRATPTGPAQAFYRFGHWGATDTIPVDGSIQNQAVWNLDTDHAFVNAAWPTLNPPVWKAH